MDGNKKRWEVATDEWQQFYEHRHDSSTGFKPFKAFPYVLELGINEKDKPLLPFRPDDTSENRILVAKSYDDTFHPLLNLRQRDRGKRRGAVRLCGRRVPTPCDN